MKEYKANWRYYFILLLFMGVTLLGIRVTWMLLNNEVMYYEEEMSREMAIGMSVLIGVVIFTYAVTVYNMLMPLIKYNREPLQITSQGIENTMVFVYVLAFFIVLPIKLIPWEAVTYYDGEEKVPYIRVNVKKVQAGRLAKLILRIMGYQFCINLVKNQVKAEDLEMYKYRFSLTRDSE